MDGGSACRKDATYTWNKGTQTTVPPGEFESTIPVFEREKMVHALDRETTVIAAHYLLLITNYY
jgi:hypothetical protein